MRKMVKKALAFVMALAITVSGLTNSTEVKGATTDILFIGNSMTYYNELQDIFEAFATKMGKDVNCKAATNGGKNLIYQSTASNVISAIDDGGYEVVIIQDIVSSFNANNLMTGAKAIIETIKQYNPNAQILFYEPWPRESSLIGASSRLDEFTQGYINAARATGGRLAPAGEAFYECYVSHGYNNYCDGLHPTPMGSFTSAATIYYALYANEGLKTFTTSDLSDLNAVVNVAQSTKKDYTLEEFNNIMASGYKYARAVAPAVADSSGNTMYTSALYTVEDPTLKVQADLSGYSKIDLSNSSVINVSSSVNSSNTGDKIIDGTTNTRWESEYSDPQYFTIKLDKTYSLNGIKLYWEGAASRKYTIETSTDNANWTTVFEQKIGTGGNESIKFDTVTNANYVRLYSTERTTSYGVSLFEAELYGSEALGSVVAPSEPETEAPTEQPTTQEPTTQAPTVGVSGTNLAIGKTAVASGFESEAMGADKAIDGNDGTRFSSNFSDDAWIYVDLGATYNVNKVYLDWEAAYGKTFDIQVSSDATNWTTVKSLTGQDGGEDTIEFNATVARYVKIQGVERATGYGYSIWELGVYASSESTDSGNTDSGNVDTSSDTNIASGKVAYASSQEADGMAAKYAVDGNDGTRWASSWTDNEWMYVDLATTYNVNKVVLNWEGAYGKAYDIQVSNDATNWTTVKSMSDQDGGEDVITFNATLARYVRMNGVTRGTGYGYSLWEMEVYATSSSNAGSDSSSGDSSSSGNTTTESANVVNGRNSTTYMTSNANNGSEGFCYVGNGFSAINTSDENLTNGNNVLGKTATTNEVAYYVDLGATYSVNKAVVYQGSTNSNYYDSYATNYSVYYSTEAVSADNQGNITWNLAGTCTNGSIYSGAKVLNAANVSDNGDAINFTGTYNARSIKIVFDKDSCMGTGTNGAGTGTTGTVSLLSVRVYTGTGSSIESAVSGTDLALNKTTYQSGSESDAMAADKAVDGNNGTRFSSNYVDDAWMYVDLGATYNINKVYINWEGAYGKAYDIQVSNDGVNWTTVQSVTNSDGGEDTITFNTTAARYVKMQGVQRATMWGYSMWDFQVFAN